jgi:hypothetical protein
MAEYHAAVERLGIGALMPLLHRRTTAQRARVQWRGATDREWVVIYRDKERRSANDADEGIRFGPANVIPGWWLFKAHLGCRDVVVAQQRAAEVRETAETKA